MPKISLLNQCSDANFAHIVAQSTSIKEIEFALGYNSYSGCVSTNIQKRIAALGLDTSHFSSAQKVVRSPENIFTENSTASQKTLRKYYLKGEYTPYICSICGQKPFWFGKELTLILDHINGNNTDDRFDNLRWVCPNCNQQLDYNRL